jgi:hypothetical protein
VIRRPLVLAIAAIAGGALLAACNPLDPLRVLDDPQGIDSLSISPDSTNATVGDTVRFTLKVLGSKNSEIAGRTARWSVGNPIVATVNDSGLVTTRAVGRTEILASVESYRVSAVLIVRPVPPPTPAP